MAQFQYSAAKKDGGIVKGVRIAENKDTLAHDLKDQDLLLLSATDTSGTSSHSLLTGDIGRYFKWLNRISIVDKMFFARNLGIMVSAGLSLTRALEILSLEIPNEKLRTIIAGVKESVMGGKTFAESLKPHEKIFGRLFVNMIEVGETTGKLSLVLRLLAKQMKKDNDLRRRVRGAMMYPVIIFVVLFSVGTLMMIYIVPSLSETIKGLGAELPTSTKIIIGISDILINYAIWFFLGLVLFIVALWRLVKTPTGKYVWDFIALRLPIFGNLVKKYNVARFCRTLTYLLTAGVPIVRSLEITASVIGNVHYRMIIEQASTEIQKGRQLFEILSQHPKLFSPVVTQMISVGEETGKVASMLLRLALFFEEEVNDATKNLSTIIEPILMVVIGIAVGFFAVAMLQPIYGGIGNA